jgi:hypothetical protein
MSRDGAPREGREREDEDDPRRLAAPDAPANRSPLADHQDALAPAECQREREASSRTERIGDNAAVANPLTSPPAGEEGDRRPR